MFRAKTGVAAHLNEIESYTHFTHCNGYVLQSAVGEAIKAMNNERHS